MKELAENEKGSFVDPKDTETIEKKRPIPEGDASAPLFKFLERIAKGMEASAANFSNSVSVLSAVRDRLENIDKTIKENTGAVNALLTTLVTSEQPIEQKKSDPTPVSRTATTSATQDAKPPLPASTPSLSSDPINITKSLFPEDLESMLNFEDSGDYITVKPRQFLGSDNFAKIASVVRAAGGEYVSAGKASHFRIPKKK